MRFRHAVGILFVTVVLTVLTGACAPAPGTELPHIAGEPVVGGTLRATPGEWAFNPEKFVYTWWSCPTETWQQSCLSLGSDGNSYSPVAADVGRWIVVGVEAENVAGSGHQMSRSVGPVRGSSTGSGAIVWAIPSLDIELLRGTTENHEVGFESTVTSLAEPRVAVSGDLASMISVDVNDIQNTSDGYVLPFSVSASAEQSGVVTGSIELFDGERSLGGALPVTVTVLAEPTGAPTTPAAPSPDRVVSYDGEQLVVEDEVVVGLRFDIGSPDSAALRIATETGGVLIGAAPGPRLFQIQFPGASVADVQAKAEQIKTMSGVEVASLNPVEYEPTAVVPNDSKWDSWSSSPGGNNWGMEWIHAPSGWDITTGRSSTAVAVIDADMDPDHGDLNDNVVRKARGLKANGHGTHVGGTVCAEGNNGKGVSGVMWDCGLRFYAAGNDAVSTAAVMDEAAQSGARVVNMSLQYIYNNTDVEVTAEVRKLASDTNDIFARPIVHAQVAAKDVLWVFAAGNEYRRDVRYTAPGGLAERFPANTISVAAIGQDGSLADFSNTGSAVSVAAPGVDIYSTLPRTGCWIFGLGCDDAYGEKSGTSMAAPHVTGLAGLVFSNKPSLTAASAKQCILAGARNSGTAVAGASFRVIDVRGALECRDPELTRVDIRRDGNDTDSFGYVEYEDLPGADIRIRIVIKGATPNTTLTAYLVCGGSHEVACGYITIGNVQTDASGDGSAVFTVTNPYTGAEDEHVDMLGGGSSFTAGPISTRSTDGPAAARTQAAMAMGGMAVGDPINR